MNLFDKICAALAFVLGIILLLLGVVGTFTGCRAHFALPPIVGAVPALVGWGIIKPVVVAWRRSVEGPGSDAPASSGYEFPTDQAGE